MTEWEEAQEKVRAVHLGAVTLLALYEHIEPLYITTAVATSLAAYKAAEGAVLGPLAEDK